MILSIKIISYFNVIEVLFYKSKVLILSINVKFVIT